MNQHTMPQAPSLGPQTEPVLGTEGALNLTGYVFITESNWKLWILPQIPLGERKKSCYRAPLKVVVVGKVISLYPQRIEIPW